MIPLTRKQLEVLRFIVDFRTRTGGGPTYGDVAAALSSTKATAYEHIEELRVKGYLARVPHGFRSLRLADGAFVPGESIRRGRARLMGTIRDGAVHWRQQP